MARKASFRVHDMVPASTHTPRCIKGVEEQLSSHSGTEQSEYDHLGQTSNCITMLAHHVMVKCDTLGVHHERNDDQDSGTREGPLFQVKISKYHCNGCS